MADDFDDEGLELQDETNDLLLRLVASSLNQEQVLERIHFWVRYLGLVVFIGLIISFVLMLTLI